MVYAWIWIAFAIAAAVCVVLQSMSGLGLCCIAVAIIILGYELVRFHRIKFMAIWPCVAGCLMFFPKFYENYMGMIAPKDAKDPQYVILSMVILYAILSILDGVVDYIMRIVRCKEVVRAYVYEQNIRRKNEQGDYVNKCYTVVSYTYNEKKYEYKGGDVREERGTQNKSIDIKIDKHCPQYLNVGTIQGKNIFSIVRGVVIIVICMFIIRG